MNASGFVNNGSADVRGGISSGENFFSVDNVTPISSQELVGPPQMYAVYPVHGQTTPAVVTFGLDRIPEIVLNVPVAFPLNSERQTQAYTSEISTTISTGPYADENQTGTHVQIFNQTIFSQQTTTPFTSETTHNFKMIKTSKLCGLPAFCANSAMTSCGNITLVECDECSMAGASIFMVLVVLLGLLIVLGNGFVIRCHLAKCKGFTGNYNRIKASLALADMLAGIQIFGIMIYNFAWSINSTADQLDERQLDLRGSSEAITGGIFYLLSFTSSLYHLLFLCYNRLGAIKRPMVYRVQESRSVHVGLAVVWSAALLVSVLPSFFPCAFTYTYNHTVFIFQITLKDWTNPILTPLVAYLIIGFILPFLLMTVLSIFSAVALRGTFTKSKELKGKTQDKDKKSKESSVFRMLAIMQVGFTITLVPLLVVVLLSYSSTLDCDNAPTPYLIGVYLTMSNSFVNVIVYSSMDKNFRAALAQDIFGRCKSRKDSKQQASKQESPNQSQESGNNSSATTIAGGSVA